MTEAQLHQSIAEWLALQFPQTSEAVLRHKVSWTTFPAGGGGSARGKTLQRLGLQAGWPDIILLIRGQFIGLELKTKNGKTSDIQDERHEQLRFSGGYVCVVRSLGEAQSHVNRYYNAMSCEFPQGIAAQ